MSIIKSLHKRNLFTVPYNWVAEPHYEVIMGSFAYGVSSDTSDCDVYGIVSPSKEMVFPHLAGHIRGFGKEPENFEVTQQHHINADDKSYDLAVYSIIKYFDLAAENNPNICDSLFVPARCITHIDPIGKLLRENRKKFLHKGAWHKFKGYAYAQLKKIRQKNPTGNRSELVEKYGYDVKFGYHVFRLISEVEQIMIEGDLDLEKNNEVMKAIRRGEWSLERLEKWFEDKEKQLDQVYIDSKLPYQPNWAQLRTILMECLELKFGSLSYIMPDDNQIIIEKYNEIRKIVER